MLVSVINVKKYSERTEDLANTATYGDRKSCPVFACRGRSPAATSGISEFICNRHIPFGWYRSGNVIFAPEDAMKVRYCFAPPLPLGLKSKNNACSALNSNSYPLAVLFPTSIQQVFASEGSSTPVSSVRTDVGPVRVSSASSS